MFKDKKIIEKLPFSESDLVKRYPGFHYERSTGDLLYTVDSLTHVLRSHLYTQA